MKACEVRELTLNTEYRKAMQWIKNAAFRGEFVVRLPQYEFIDLRKLHDKFVMDGFDCLLFGEANPILEVRW